MDAIRRGDPQALHAVDRLLNDMRHIDDITERELELLQHLANGDTTRQAAKRMWIQPDSAYKTLKRVCPKLGANNKTHAVAVALREGMIR